MSCVPRWFPILGWARLLKTRKFDEESTKRALDTIERNAQLQTQLIEDLLDVSRILRGKIVLNVAPVSLVTTLQAAIETVRLSADAKAIDLRLEIADFRVENQLADSQSHDLKSSISNPQSSISNPQYQVLGDSTRLQQVVWNLLSNAVKFTPEGDALR